MIRRALTAPLLATLMAGCLNYQLGTTLPANLRAVHVPSVNNSSSEPGVDSKATAAVLREIQREGTLVLTAEHSATTRLDITVVRFRMEPVRYERDDTQTPDEYRALIVADVSFRSLRDDKILFAGAVEGETVFPSGTDLVSAKQDMLPKACDDLARRIIDRCISVW
jgi:hypothetical protein